MTAWYEGLTALVVDDDDRLAHRLSLALSARGLRVRSAGDGAAALVAVDEAPPDLVVLDLKMPGMGGLEVLRSLLQRAPEAQVVVLTGYGSIATAVDAVRLGAVDYLQKPATTDEILEAFARGMQDPLTSGEPDYETPTLARAEWEHLQRVLTDCGGNITHAARILGMHRRTLQRKLGKLPPRT